MRRLCLCGWQPFPDHGRSFIEVNNQHLDRLTPTEWRSIGVHICPGGDKDSTHSADVDHAALISYLFQPKHRLAGIVAILLLLIAAASVMACLAAVVMNHDTRNAL
jgi:hypothetical protein